MNFLENVILGTSMKICPYTQIQLISGTLHEDLSRFYFFRRHEITIETPSWDDVVSASITYNV